MYNIMVDKGLEPFYLVTRRGLKCAAALTVWLIVRLALGVLLAPLGTEAQPPRKVPRIGYLLISPLTDPPSAERREFLQGLRELGYVEGEGMIIEYRSAVLNPELLPDLAAELVNLKVDVIVAVGSQAVKASKEATTTIPIVFPVAADPVAAGFVSSLARPGGNVTGLTFISPDLAAKRLGLLKEAIPRISRVAVLWNSANPGVTPEWGETQAAARALRVGLQSVEVKSSKDLASAFSLIVRERPEALIVIPDPLTSSHRHIIVDFAAKQRLPAMYGLREFADAGGLVSYGASVPALFRRAAVYADKILKGVKPADLPVEQPTRFELVINLKTAKALGLTIPQSVLIRADEVIQ